MSGDILRKALTRGGLSVAVLSVICSLTGCKVKSTEIGGECTTADGGSCKASIKIILDPPGSDVAAIDTTQGLMAISLSNATLASTSGTFTVSIKDITTNTIVGQQSFGYVVRGSSLYASEPTAVHNWLQQFSGYADVDVIIDTAPTINAASAGSASATTSAVYQGITYASATVSWEYVAGGGGPCRTNPCPVQE